MGKYTHHKEKYTKENLEEIVSRCKTTTEVLGELKIVAAGGNFKTIKRYIKEYGIDTSHFCKGGWTKETRPNFKHEKVPNEKIFKENSHWVQSNQIKKRALEEGFLENKCYIEECPIKTPEWLGRPLSLELDHINGIDDDNRVENLRILCAHCHSQTPTFRGRNKKVGRSIEKTLKPVKESKKHFCIDCQKELSSDYKRCLNCLNS